MSAPLLHDHTQRRGDRYQAPLDVEHFERSIGLVLDRLVAVEAGQLTKADLADAMRAGIVAAAESPTTWCAAADGLRTAAEKKAGSWLMGWFLRWLLRGALLMGGGVIVYQLGGWSALAAMWGKLGGHP